MKRKFSALDGKETNETSSENSASSQGDTTRPPSVSPPSIYPPPPPISIPPRSTTTTGIIHPPHSLNHPSPLVGLPFHSVFPPTMSQPASPTQAPIAVPRPPAQMPPFRRILVINPNKSIEMSNTLRTMVRPPPGTMVQYYTTADGPPSIDGVRTSVQSTMAALGPLIHGNALGGHDGFLVACYSAHPLVECLREMTSKPVMGIFQASIFWALSLGGRFGIVTTNQRWDYILTKSVHDLIGSNPSFAKVLCTGYSAAEVHGETNRNKVQRAMAEAALKLVREDHCDIIILGCAGMSGLEQTIRDAVGRDVTIIDGVVAGVHMLAGLIHSGQQTSAAGAYG